MKTIFDRTKMLIGEDELNRLKKKKVIVFGIGGVGGFACEALARAGIGNLTLVDFDKVDITNLNRQIVALQSTIGKLKAEVMAQRLMDINDELNVKAITEKLTLDNIEKFHLRDYDYILDAIDDVDGKIALIQYASMRSIPIISSMGTGNKFDPKLFKIADIKKTHTCPLAKVVRKRLRNIGINSLKVLFSTELPHRREQPEDGTHVPASISFVPATAGLLLASEIVRDFIMSGPVEKTIFGIKL